MRRRGRRCRRCHDDRSDRERDPGQHGHRSRRFHPRLHLRDEGAQGDTQGAGTATDRPRVVPRVRDLRGGHGGRLLGPDRGPAAARGYRSLRRGRDPRDRAPPARGGLPTRAEAEQARRREDARLRPGDAGHRRGQAVLRRDRRLPIRPVDQRSGVLLSPEEGNEVPGQRRADRRLASCRRVGRRTQRAVARTGAPRRPGDAAHRVSPLPQLHPRQ